MSLGQCVVQWEGAFGVLVSEGDPVYCSVCMGAVNALFSVHGGHSMYCSVGGTFSVYGGTFSVMLTGLILCNLQAATVTVGS